MSGLDRSVEIARRVATQLGQGPSAQTAAGFDIETIDAGKETPTGLETGKIFHPAA